MTRSNSINLPTNCENYQLFPCYLTYLGMHECFSNTASTYLLTNAVQTEEQHLDDTEDMMVSEMPFSTYGKRVLSGQPRPIFSALAYFLALERLREWPYRGSVCD